MLFMLQPGPSRMIVLRCSSTAYRSKEESSKGLFLSDTARTDWHFGNLWLMAPDAFD